MAVMDLRKIDALVAEHVMGFQYRATLPGDQAVSFLTTDDRYPLAQGHEIRAPYMDRVPHYSTDISEAWKVVEKLAPDDDEFRLCNFHRQGWQCTFRYFEGEREEAETPALAICLAALTAKGVEV